MITAVFADRREAGRRLASELESFRSSGPIVLALPRGGVPVAFEVAKALAAPLDVLIVRKIGLPGHPEFGVGALVLTAEPLLVMNKELLGQLRPDPAKMQQVVDHEFAEARRRSKLYRGDRSPPVLAGRTVIVVDDGLATGGSARAALQAVRQESPAFLILAVPVGSPDSIASLRSECDFIVCPVQPTSFHAVGALYRDFSQTEDSEVLRLLQEAADRPAAAE